MRIALRVEYDGSAYVGWETQSNGLAVQACLEQALEAVARHEVNTVCAGRTDSKVHALGQVIHFDTSAVRPLRAWTLGVNTKLRADISVTWAGCVPDSFSARFSARRRHYRYLVFNRRTRPALHARYTAWESRPLDERAMELAAKTLIGTHDFSAFRAAGCQAKTPIRTVHRARVQRKGDLIILDLTANAFLYHMVRNIVGTLVQIGLDKYPPCWLREVLAGADRKRAGPTAPPQGLYFLGAEYPRRFGLPAIPRKMPLW